MVSKNNTALRSALRVAAFFLVLAAGTWNLYAQSAFISIPAGAGSSWKTNIEGYFDWSRGIISATVDLELASAGVKLPTGRMRAEGILEDEYFKLMQPYLLSLKVDSSSTINDLIMRGEFSQEAFNRIKLDTQKVPPWLTADLSRITGRYTFSMNRISVAVSPGHYSGNIPRPFIPSRTADYTGIVIIADTSLPIHGRNSSSLLEPCLFPKIWDTGMTLIYEKNMTRPILQQEPKPIVVYTRKENIFLPTPSGIDPGLAETVGNNPLRIIARGVYGISPTDPVIDSEDALLILSSENNRRLLRESRIAIVVNESVLSAPFNE